MGIFKNQLETFVSQLAASGKNVPLFILVDELYRCRPLYAITVLERIKHLFDVSGVVFVIATDSSQLRHAVRAVYGTGFDSERYLLRFFDRAYLLGRTSRSKFVAYQLQTLNARADLLASMDHDPIDFCVRIFEQLGVGLRDIEQCIDMLRTVMSVWIYPNKIELIYLLPLIILFQQARYGEFGELARAEPSSAVFNKNPEPFTLKFKPLQRTYGSDPKVEEVSLYSLLTDILSLMKGAFPIRSIDPKTRRQLVVQRIFEEEYSKFYQNSHNPASPLKTTLWQYGDLVRSAGRLVAPVPRE